MYVLFDVEWVTAADGARSMTQLAALRTDSAWACCGEFHTLVCPAEYDADWEQVAYNGYSPDEFRAAPEEKDALLDFLRWLKPDDVLCCWHDRNGKTLEALCRCLTFTALPCPWAAANHAVYAWFAKKGIDDPGGLYRCAQLWGLKLPVPEHDARHDASVLRALLEQLQLPPDRIFKKKSTVSPPKENPPAETELSVREQAVRQIEASPYNYIYLKDSPVFHRRECKLLLHSRDILGSIHYKTAAKGRRPCKVCKPQRLSTEQALELAATYGPDQAFLRQVAARYKQKQLADELIKVRLLGGKTVEIGRNALVGCCHNQIHPGKMTKKLMEAHDCLGKECRFFEKYEDSIYWRDHARKAALRQEARKQRNIQKEQKQQKEAVGLSLKDQFQTYAEDAGYVLRIIRVQEDRRNIFRVFFVSENPFRDGNQFPNFLSRIRDEHPSYSIVMRHIQDMDGHFVTIEEYDRLRR